MAVHPDAFVHKSAVVDEGAVIGERTKVWHFAHVCADAIVGPRCVLGQNVFLAPGVRLGAGVKIQNNVSVYKGVVVEDDAFLGPSCVFTNVDHPRAHVERKTEFSPTRVGKGASIGANATIVCGNQLGDYCFVGAGAVVTHDVQSHSLVYGTPARHRGWVCRCGEILPDSGRCERCGDIYELGESCQLLKEGQS